jgi:hypothetical protein
MAKMGEMAPSLHWSIETSGADREGGKKRKRSGRKKKSRNGKQNNVE